MPGAHEPRLINAPDETRDVIASLVERYRRDADHYSSTAYNEAQTRVVLHIGLTEAHKEDT